LFWYLQKRHGERSEAIQVNIWIATALRASQ